MPKLDLPSWEILEEAKSFLESALLIEKHGGENHLRPACVYAGFSMELFLKSFLASDDSTPLDISFPSGLQMYQGGVKSEYGHNLMDLFNKIPAQYQKLILDASEELKPGYPLKDKFKDYAGYFFNARYGYENTKQSIGVLRLEVLDAAEHFGKVCYAVDRSELAQ